MFKIKLSLEEVWFIKVLARDAMLSIVFMFMLLSLLLPNAVFWSLAPIVISLIFSIVLVWVSILYQVQTKTSRPAFVKMVNKSMFFYSIFIAILAISLIPIATVNDKEAGELLQIAISIVVFSFFAALVNAPKKSEYM